MTPPKPSSKEIIEEDVHTSQLHLNNELQENQQQLDERFNSADVDLQQMIGQLNAQMENERNEAYNCYDSLMSILTKLFHQKEHQPTAAQATTSSSSIIQKISTVPMNTTIVSHVITPSQTPTRTTPIYSHHHYIPLSPQSLELPLFPYRRSQHTTISHKPFPPNKPICHPTFQLDTHPTRILTINFHNNLHTTRSPKLIIFPISILLNWNLTYLMVQTLLEWLFQAEQFFNFYQLPPENRLSMMSFYMKGEALCWFKWMHQNQLLLDWVSFTRALELRFGPSTYANHQAELFKLKRTAVVEYQAAFEKLGNQVVGLTHEAILNCFISGLAPAIQNEIVIHKPVSIYQAIGLAKSIE